MKKTIILSTALLTGMTLAAGPRITQADKDRAAKLVSQMTANVIQYDTISDSRHHWKATNYKIRTLKGLREKIETGAEIDTMIMMEPMDLVYSKGQQEQFTSPELLRYIAARQT